MIERATPTLPAGWRYLSPVASEVATLTDEAIGKISDAFYRALHRATDQRQGGRRLDDKPHALHCRFSADYWQSQERLQGRLAHGTAWQPANRFC